MNQHLTQEDIVAAYYGESGMDEHLSTCAACKAELARLAVILDQVETPAVPEPDEDYEERVWQRLRWRMRSEAKRGKLTNWMKWTAVAAVTFMSFCTGLIWRRTPEPVSHDARIQTTTTAAAQAVNNAPTTQAQRDRVLLVVVNDHFDRSERILIELTNLTPQGDTIDIAAERDLAEELLTSNRLYRRTALDRGEESVATLLDELEPVLMQIAHAPDDMTASELRRIQKRVESKGLVFKMRVLRNDARAATPNVTQPNV